VNGVGAIRRALLPALMAGIAGCRPAPDAVEWLTGVQRSDGLWATDTYGPLARGESTTAVLALALSRQSSGDVYSRAAAGRALLALIARGAPSPTTPPEPVDYPIYTAACLLHTLAVLAPDEHTEVRTALSSWLRSRQLTEALGWQPEQPEYGAFGLGDRVVQQPDGADLIGLAPVTFVLEALQAAAVPPTDPMVQAARTFVERCQDHAGDGGFAYAPTADWRAGKAGMTDTKPPRARSYGTTTADGLRALLAAGLPPDHARVRAALAWLVQRAHDVRVPGLVEAAPELEPSLRLYWLQTWARTLPFVDAATAARWRPAIAAALATFQQPDGSYRNPANAMKEDDPLVATALGLFAAAALAAR
jgi:hypothetical protein